MDIKKTISVSLLTVLAATSLVLLGDTNKAGDLAMEKSEREAKQTQLDLIERKAEIAAINARGFDNISNKEFRGALVKRASIVGQKQAIKELQFAIGMSGDPVMGPNTVKTFEKSSLNKVLKNIKFNKYFCELVSKSGVSGATVKVQRMLGINVDGQFGSDTKKAVDKSFSPKMDSKEAYSPTYIASL